MPISLPISQAASRAKPGIAEGEAIRLNLGGRNRPIPGFKIVDLYEGGEVDIQTDCGALGMFGNGTVSEIYASHILEHWSHLETLIVLKEWRRVLKKGAKAYVSVPDFEAAVRIFNQVGFCDFVRNLLWGDQEYPLAFHYTCFTFASLAAVLVKAGFEDVKRLDRMPYGLSDCSSNVDTLLKKPISVSVEATA